VDRSSPLTGKVSNNFIKAICYFLAMVLGALTLSYSSVSADTTPSTCVLRWGIINTPGSFPQRNDIVSPCDITSLAASHDGKTIYAVDLPNTGILSVIKAGIWKSADGGISWSHSPTRWLAKAQPPPVAPFAEIAVAPDDPDFIAVVCMDTSGAHRREIYISEDGGTNWTYSGRIPWTYGTAEQVGSIAISPGYNLTGHTVRDIIAGSRIPADGLGQGQIYLLRYPGLAGWKAQDFNNGDIIALTLSPVYHEEGSLVVMSSTAERTYINIGFRDFGANACTWNTAQGWPVELCTPGQAGGTGSGETRIITGCLALPSDFMGTAPAKRIVFAAYDSNGLASGGGHPMDDVYRLNDTVVTGLKTPADGSRPRISSIAYTGSTKAGRLLAGSVKADPATAQATVWLTANPLAQQPCWTKPLKAPTGGYGTGFSNVKLAWTQEGSAAICGTGAGNRDTPLKWADPTGPAWAPVPLDETAFSISRDNGTTWDQLGLIDTRINRFRALEAAPDGKTIYLSSVNDNGLDSTWRSTSSINGEIWERVLCWDCPAPLLKLAPDKKDGSVIFLGTAGESRVLRSRDTGRTWQECRPGAILQDMAAVSSNSLVILQADGLARRGEYDPAGWQWKKFIDTGVSPAHTIAALNNNLLVGAALGQSCPASLSTDRGDHWELITQQTFSCGNRHVAFDDDFKNNRIIYLADDAGGLYRWSAGTSNRWDDMVPANSSYYGIVALARDTLYAAYSPNGNGVDRTLYSRAGIPKSGVSWDSLSAGLSSGVLFRLEPVALVCPADTIWAIDARDYSPSTGVGLLWAFKDTLAGHAPWLIEPKGGSLIGCDPVSGRNAQVDLKWEQLSLASAYQIEIGKDKWFDLPVSNAEPTDNPFFSPADLLYPAYYINDGLLPEAGHTYYWRVRVRKATTGQSIRSLWSYALSFNISPGYQVVERVMPAAESGQSLPAAPVPSAPPLPPQLLFRDADTANALRIILTCVILFGLFIQVIIYHRRRS